MNAAQAHLEIDHRSSVIVKFKITDFTILDFTISVPVVAVTGGNAA
jgi:hypothetical protein